MGKLTKAALLGLGLIVAQPGHGYGLFGPGKFEVKSSDDRFSTSDTVTLTGINNRISKKSIAGGMHIDASGMYVEPVLTKRKADGAVVAMGLFLHNETEHDTNYGSPNRIGTPRTITFIIDGGAPMALTLTKSDSRWGDKIDYNTVSRSASSSISESGFANLTPEQAQALAAAKSIAVKVDGDGRSVVYEPKDIAKSFLANLRAVFGAAAEARQR